MKLGNTPQAFPYQGSKRKLASVIVSCIPEGTECLLEPFAGSAAVSVAAAWLGLADRFWLNDTHAALMSLWQRIIHDPKGLSEDYRRIWHEQLGREREYYNALRDEFNRAHRPEHLLFLLARCVKAAIRYNRSGKFNNSPDHRRKGMNPETMGKNILLVSQILGESTRISSDDYTVVLRDAGAQDLVYMDPPYQGVCKNRDSRYVGGVDFEEFVAELATLNERNVPFIVSYDGRTGDKSFGKKLPDGLKLFHTELPVGRSTQATLLGRAHHTYESLYVSRAAVDRLNGVPDALAPRESRAPSLFD